MGTAGAGLFKAVHLYKEELGVRAVNDPLDSSLAATAGAPPFRQRHIPLQLVLQGRLDTHVLCAALVN